MLNKPIKIKTLSSIEDFDEISAEDIEEARQSLLLTPLEMAEALDWSPRKYSRVLDAAREAGAVNRDVALAVRGVMEVRGDCKSSPQIDQDDRSFLGGKSFEEIFKRHRHEAGGWTAEVAPDLLRLLVERVLVNGSTITYGEVATTLEERSLTHRVWPRTAYGSPLGLICEALLELSEQTNNRIPLISVIVTRAGGDPSYGIDGLVKSYFKLHEPKAVRKEQVARLKRDRSSLMKDLQREVFDYPHWPGVVRALVGRSS